VLNETSAAEEGIGHMGIVLHGNLFAVQRLKFVVLLQKG
jgi:hypothetical protein